MKIPRAAVSVCMRCQQSYLLIQRGNPPSQGMWSFPGGKLEWGESTMEGARRELHEEVQFASPVQLEWSTDPFCTSDSISDGYHYLIAQCFAECLAEEPPLVMSSDDADDAQWWTFSEIDHLIKNKKATPGIEGVIRRANELSKNGMLPTASDGG